MLMGMGKFSVVYLWTEVQSLPVSSMSALDLVISKTWMANKHWYFPVCLAVDEINRKCFTFQNLKVAKEHLQKVQSVRIIANIYHLLFPNKLATDYIQKLYLISKISLYRFELC